jgi:glycosyltransferase involved in cell wall biosynthesis
LGVGGTTLTGYKAAIADGADIIVKIDGDGQMDPRLLPRFVQPILGGGADYVKGNRFANLEDPKRMPAIRLVGNAILSFLNKLSSGYWTVFDPTNGYTAIHAEVARRIVDRPVSPRYFFESDMLHHLNMVRAVVTEVPMKALYGDEMSNLKISRILLPFIYRHARNTLRRIAVQYFLRDFSLASLELLIGVAAITFGTTFGIRGWLLSIETLEPATAGTVMLAALPVIVGMQLLLNAVNYDIQNSPRMPLHVLLKKVKP